MDTKQWRGFLGVLLLFSATAEAQNLVRNGSFEEAAKCPAAYLDFDNVAGWRIFQGTPDYFAACAANRELGVPQNYHGTRSTFFGRAYASLVVVHVSPHGKGAPDKSYRLSEAICTQTTRPLQRGKDYELTFWISLSDSSFFSTPRLYCSFSEGAPKPSKSVKGFVGRWNAFETSDNYACDMAFDIKGQWNQVTVRFTAPRNYQYLAIGLPRPQYTKAQYRLDLTRPRRKLPASKWEEKSAYYYVDNVSLVEL